MSKPDYFDDCEICRAVRVAEEQNKPMSEKDILAAFDRQKAAGIGVFCSGKDLENLQ